ncbi:MAG TPA: hypothetical protein ENN06_07650 [Desulfobacteraceae bacterium]|nr:hypothetical protein [Desulfobacteraceae bacterium]
MIYDEEPMAESLDKQVERLLQEGTSKKAIFSRLRTEENQAKLLFLLNNKSPLFRRRKYMWVNLLLGAVLLAMTLRRLAAISAAGHFDFYLAADFIVPTINFYVLREIFRFHRTGYLFLTLLTCLSFLYRENRVLPDLGINIGMVVAAMYLYIRLFPKNERIS